MSGQPPSKDDQISPYTGASGRSRDTTPESEQQNEEQRRNLFRNLVALQNSPALDAVARQPGMPERSDYPSQEAWLRALLTASLQQTDATREYFGHEDNETNGHEDNETNNEGDQGQGHQDPGESKDDGA